MGNAAWLQQKTGCRVYLSETELDYIRGDRALLPKKQQMCKDLGLESPETFDVYPTDGRLVDFRVVPTPGHTAGHVSLLYHQSVLFGGDLFVYRNGVLEHAMPMWSEDMESAIASLRSLAELPFDTLCPAHFGPCKNRAALEELYASL